LPYAKQILQSGKKGALSPNDYHANKTREFDAFQEIIAPIKYGDINMSGVGLLGRIAGENKNSQGWHQKGVKLGSNNNIANNPKMSSGKYKFYTLYPQEYFPRLANILARQAATRARQRIDNK